MEDELEFEEIEEPKINRPDQRVKKLLSEREEAIQGKADSDKAKEEAEAKAIESQKEAEFYKDFSAQTAKYPNAPEFQDAIKEKVMAGYSVDDATVAVLAREGKFNPAPEGAVEVESPAGGSAPTAMSAAVDKPLSEMTRDEKRAQLVELEAKGDISLS